METYLTYNGKEYTIKQVYEAIEEAYDITYNDPTIIDKKQSAYNSADNTAFGFALAKFGINDWRDYRENKDIAIKVTDERNRLRRMAIGS